MSRGILKAMAERVAEMRMGEVEIAPWKTEHISALIEMARKAEGKA